MLIKLEVLEQLEQRVFLFTLRHLLRHIPESPLILLAFLLHCLHPGLVVLIIPLQTLLATSVFHVQTHREPRALTGLLLLPQWLCNVIVYYESIKREPKIRGIYECRCDERLQTKSKEFTRLAYTGLVLELEHLKT
jgi:hypothetical protein